MTVQAPCLSIVLLTEDSAQDARATVEAVVRKMLGLIVPGYGSHRIDFVPREPFEEEAMRGNVWKTDGKNPMERDRKVRLLRYIARVLSRVNVARARPRAPTAASPPPPPPLHLERLLLICPFRSIEAWLYQNVRTGIDICRREHQGQHIAELQRWEGRREELDELPAPEKEVCLEKRFNRELATTGFPAREAYEVKKSFAESVDRLTGCDALVRALERTHGWS